MIDTIKIMYKEERGKVVEGFQTIYDHSVRMANNVGVVPSIPRLAGRQKHHSNVPADSAFEYCSHFIPGSHLS